MALFNPISIINEMYQNGKFIVAPRYIDETLPNGVFLCALDIDGQICKGHGRSKKQAKTDAAQKYVESKLCPGLTSVQVEKDILEPCTELGQSRISNPVGTLLEKCVSKHIPTPIFTTISQSGPSHQPVFNVKCELGSLIEHGNGNSKKEAQREAAAKILEKFNDITPKLEDYFEILNVSEVENLEIAPIETNKSSICCSQSNGDIVDGNNSELIPSSIEILSEPILNFAEIQKQNKLLLSNDADINPIDILMKLGELNLFPFPTFANIASDGEYIVECEIGKFVKDIGHGSKRKFAQQNAAEKILNRLLQMDETKFIENTIVNTPAKQESPMHKYKKLKNQNYQYNLLKVKLSDRHNYFKSFDGQIKQQIANILSTNDQLQIDSYEIIRQICAALNLKYEIEQFSNYSDNYRFTLDTAFDCVISGKYNELATNIIEYFKIMLGFQKAPL